MRSFLATALLCLGLLSRADGRNTSCLSFFEPKVNDNGHSLAILTDQYYFNVQDVDDVDYYVDSTLSSVAVIVEDDTTADVTIEVYTVAENDDLGVLPYHATRPFPDASWERVASVVAAAGAGCRSLSIDLEPQVELGPTPRGFYIRAVDRDGNPASVLRGQDGSYPCQGGPDDEINFACDGELANTVRLDLVLLALVEEIVVTSYEHNHCFVSVGSGVNACEHGFCSSSDPGVCSCEPGFDGLRCNTIVEPDLISDVLTSRFLGGVCFDYDGEGDDTTYGPLESELVTGDIPCSPTSVPTMAPTEVPTPTPTVAPPSPAPTPYNDACLQSPQGDNDNRHVLDGIYFDVASTRTDGKTVYVKNFYVQAETGTRTQGETVIVFTPKDGRSYKEHLNGEEDEWEAIARPQFFDFPANWLLDLELDLNIPLDTSGEPRGFFVARTEFSGQWHNFKSAPNFTSNGDISVAAGTGHGSHDHPGGFLPEAHYFDGVVCYEVEPDATPVPSDAPTPIETAAPTPSVDDGAEAASESESDGMSPGALAGIIIGVLVVVLLLVAGAYSIGRKKALNVRAPQSSGASQTGVEFAEVDPED